MPPLLSLACWVIGILILGKEVVKLVHGEAGVGEMLECRGCGGARGPRAGHGQLQEWLVQGQEGAPTHL